MALAKPYPWFPGINRYHPLARNVEAYWPFWEGVGKTVADVANPNPKALLGTLTNMDPATDWVPTEKGWALDFDGASSQHVLVGQQAELQIKGPFAMASRFTMASGSATQGVVSQIAGSGAGYWGIWIRSNNKIEVNYNQSGVGFTDASWTTALTVGQTYDVVGQWDGSDLKLFVDGIERASTGATGVVTGGGSPDLVFGAITTSALFFDGTIEWVGIRSRSFVLNEIQQLHVDPYALLRPRRRMFAAAGLSIPIAMRHYMQMQGAG